MSRDVPSVTRAALDSRTSPGGDNFGSARVLSRGAGQHSAPDMADEAGTISATAAGMPALSLASSPLRRAVGLTTLALVVALGATACASRRISHVLDDPYRYRNRDVQISGRVVDSYSVGNRGAYRIEDRSGQIWVVSDHGVPRRGADVRVVGTVRDALNLGPLGALIKLPITGAVILVESDRRVR